MDKAVSPSFNLLNQLMSAAGWHSSQNRLFEAVPHMSDELTPFDMVSTFRNLGVPTSSQRCKLNEIEADDCPALFVDTQDCMQAILDADQGNLLVCQLGDTDPRWVKASSLAGRLVRLERFQNEQNAKTRYSFSQITRPFKGLMPWLFIASFMSNLASLATPLLIMVIYDRVIPSGSVDLITSLALVALILLATDAGFRLIRYRVIAHMGRETELGLGLALFQKILALPVSQIQKASVEQQLARFRQFESLRDVFTGQILVAVLDLPFTLIFLAVLYILSPQIAFLIVALIIVFVVITCITLPIQTSRNASAAEHKAALQSYMFETAQNQQAIQRLGLIDHWTKQGEAMNRKAARATRLASQLQLVTQNLGQSLMAIAGLGAVILGTLSAMQGTMSFGALIAVLSLVWKVLTPLQALYANSAQIVSFQNSKTQSDRVLNLPEEMVRGVAQNHQKTLKGQISVSGVTHRYDSASAPVLSQVSMDIKANEFVVLGGSSNSGKTTLLNLLQGFYQPSLGSIQIDDLDLRHIAVDDLRRSVSYCLSPPELFYGTIYQNFKLAAPSLSRDDVIEALVQMDLLEEIDGFTDGLDTRLSEAFRSTLPLSTLRALGISRTIARGGSVCMLNEPFAGLDTKHRAALLRTMQDLKGSRTFIVATQDISVAQLADHYIFLQNGRVVADDLGNAGLKKFNALLNRTGAS
ncbi:ABC transporter ATP-binding protein [Roseobacter denitrificans]|uniref:Toxin secretion ABC transporter, ATP binding component, putative n=1 Tax=Roseobacter denitrificans (strain ATCC 33942 / OCh 114) TaxID=375451 RepID=Q161Z5_ROSDO|nr:ABC transporter transmembrane domain-containing protein [Roseobacter denitrificans]ABG33198.1 toxin secretion ABC transporter, ATP binding component, putative [Roseobacter denitrificans OCh 114]AVL52548.1 ABC transporter ATP-binding protein [Roseobacter denitrificans]SFG29788.1 ATP-binding cassette, subfamily C/ATP-binding cassette, subfamily C, LapB [Roseobacter denitrificans OCh 114]